MRPEGKMLSKKGARASCKCSEMVTFVILLLSTFFAQALSKLRKSLRDKKSMSNASPSPVGSSGSFFFGGGSATGNPADQVNTTLQSMMYTPNSVRHGLGPTSWEQAR